MIRVDPGILGALQKWAGDDLRSLNGQIEFVLRRALEKAGRLPVQAESPKPPDA